MTMKNRQKNNFMLLNPAEETDEEKEETETKVTVVVPPRESPVPREEPTQCATKRPVTKRPATQPAPKTKGRGGRSVSELMGRDLASSSAARVNSPPLWASGAKREKAGVSPEAAPLVTEITEEEGAELTPTGSLESCSRTPLRKHSRSARSSHERKAPRWSKLVFLFGTIFGVLAALYFGATKASTVDFPDLDAYVNFDSMGSFFEDWKSVLPGPVLNIMTDFMEQSKLEGSAESFAVGRTMFKEGLRSNLPVVLVPGVISTGLESWGLHGPENCPSEPHFRKRLWGSYYMLKTMVMDKQCWLKHIMLDADTGLDPPNVRIRAAQGFEATDFFVAGYWIWNKILQNLAVIGYQPETMASAAYDWRLSYLDLETRDQYFSKLKALIEMQNKGLRKSLLVGHSMGSQVIFYFMKWVEAEGFGNGGPTWVNDNIEGFVNIAGTMLGTPKAIPALLSGEMRDTIQLNALAVQGLEKFFSRRERADMLRSFGGIASMIPKGGEVIWGDQHSAPDDDDSLFDLDSTNNDKVNAPIDTFGNFISFANATGRYSQKNLTMTESIAFLLEQTPQAFQRRTKQHYSFGIATTPAELKANEGDYSKWSNPLEAALPNAPDMKIYCFYGVGKPTERSYTYREETGGEANHLNVTIDLASQNAVKLADGDGTVSILTHAMCHKWKEADNIYNPGKSRVTIVEMKDEPERFDIRGGAKTADHVDILGSAELNELVLRVAGGQGDSIEDRYVSNLNDLVAKMKFNR